MGRMSIVMFEVGSIRGVDLSTQISLQNSVGNICSFQWDKPPTLLMLDLGVLDKLDRANL